MTFSDLPLDPKILRAIESAGYTQPTEIQNKAIPKVLQGFDIRASAQTGTGKTAAFILPALQLLTMPRKKGGKGPRVLILAPTRELALQIAEQAAKYSKFLNRVVTICIYGGVPYYKQTRELMQPHDILIATPGRLIDFTDQGKVDFSSVEMLILDEADRMLDMGFVDPVKQIAARTPSTRQTLLFSATLKGEVIKLSEALMKKPMDITVHAAQEKHENIEQFMHYVDNLKHKNRLLDHLLRQQSVENALVFTSTKRHADELVGTLHEEGHRVAALHGDMNQRQRTRTVDMLKSGKINVVVATDVAARGIDVKSITHVINYDLPRNAEDYVHRIGRTGRAGALGTAHSFVSGQDRMLLKRIEQYTGHRLEIASIEGFEAGKQHQSEPSRFNRKPSSRQFEPRRQGPGAPSRFPRKSFSKPYGSGSQGEGESSRSTRKPFSKPFEAGNREEGNSFGAPRKSFSKPYDSGRREEGNSSGAPRKSFSKPYDSGRREEGSSSGAPRKSFSKPYDSGRREEGNSSGAPRKSFSKPFDSTSQGQGESSRPPRKSFTKSFDSASQGQGESSRPPRKSFTKSFDSGSQGQGESTRSPRKSFSSQSGDKPNQRSGPRSATTPWIKAGKSRTFRKPKASV